MCSVSEHTGKKYRSKNYGDVVVTNYVNNKNVFVKFLHTGYETKAELKDVKKGNIKDKFAKTVYGVGITGDESTTENGKHIKEYVVWSSLLQRCYDVKFLKRYLTYEGCVVSENFKYFPYFKEWYLKQIGSNKDGWELDKDILVKGNRLYSEDTCCFVPKEINLLFSKAHSENGELPIGVSYHNKGCRYKARISVNGSNNYLGLFNTPEEAFQAYKRAKESYIKAVADKWKDQIDPRVYEALMNWKVEITD